MKPRGHAVARVGGRCRPLAAVVARAPLMIALRGKALIFSTESTPRGARVTAVTTYSPVGPATSSSSSSSSAQPGSVARGVSTVSASSSSASLSPSSSGWCSQTHRLDNPSLPCHLHSSYNESGLLATNGQVYNVQLPINVQKYIAGFGSREIMLSREIIMFREMKVFVAGLLNV